MIGAAKRYAELLTTLLIDRELAGGALPDEVESRHVEELDRCWWAMTDAEQDDIERLLADETPIAAPVELLQLDVLLTQGARELPRRAA